MDEELRTYRIIDGLGVGVSVAGTHFDVEGERLWVHRGDEIVAAFQRWHSLIDVTTTE